MGCENLSTETVSDRRARGPVCDVVIWPAGFREVAIVRVELVLVLSMAKTELIGIDIVGEVRIGARHRPTRRANHPGLGRICGTHDAGARVADVGHHLSADDQFVTRRIIVQLLRIEVGLVPALVCGRVRLPTGCNQLLLGPRRPWRISRRGRSGGRIAGDIGLTALHNLLESFQIRSDLLIGRLSQYAGDQIAQPTHRRVVRDVDGHFGSARSGIEEADRARVADVGALERVPRDQLIRLVLDYLRIPFDAPGRSLGPPMGDALRIALDRGEVIHKLRQLGQVAPEGIDLWPRSFNGNSLMNMHGHIPPLQGGSRICVVEHQLPQPYPGGAARWSGQLPTSDAWTTVVGRWTLAEFLVSSF